MQFREGVNHECGWKESLDARVTECNIAFDSASVPPASLIGPCPVKPWQRQSTSDEDPKNTKN